MKRTLRYISSSIIICFLFTATKAQDVRIKGLRLGVDLSRFSLYYLEPARTCFQVSVDFELTDNLYPTVEYGQQGVSVKKSNYHYSSQGDYFRVGADYNFLKFKPQNQYDMLFLGLRYGRSKMSQSATDVKAYSGYWGNYTGGIIAGNIIYTNWIEIDAGIRAEIFKNFFMGWSVSGRLMIKKTKDNFMDPYNIPGYGSGSNNSGFGINYSIYYRLPIFKEKIKEPVTKKEE